MAKQPIRTLPSGLRELSDSPPAGDFKDTPPAAEAPAAVAEAPPPAPVVKATAAPPVKHLYRVSLKAVKVLHINERGVPEHHDHLDIEAESEDAAIAEFARYNGIPYRLEVLTGKQRLASEHPVKVELLK